MATWETRIPGPPGLEPSLRSRMIAFACSTLGYRNRCNSCPERDVIHDTSKLFVSGTATSRRCFDNPSFRNNSMLREFVISVLGWRVVDGFFSTSMHSIPNDASVFANVMPTGPPPAIRTGTSFMGFLHIPGRGAHSAPRAANLRSSPRDRKLDPFPLGAPSFTLGKLYRRKICQ